MHEESAGSQQIGQRSRFRSNGFLLRRRDERGATMVEYALLVALLAVPTIGALMLIEDSVDRQIDATADAISRRPAPGETP